MKVILLRDQRILHKSGETVEVSPSVFDFLITNGAAKPVEEAAQAKPTRKKAAK